METFALIYPLHDVAAREITTISVFVRFASILESQWITNFLFFESSVNFSRISLFIDMRSLIRFRRTVSYEIFNLSISICREPPIVSTIQVEFEFNLKISSTSNKTIERVLYEMCLDECIFLV